MKLVAFGILFLILAAISMAAFASFSYVENKNSDLQNGIKIEGNVGTITEQECNENAKEIKCKEKTYLVVDGKKYIEPSFTGYIIKEKVFVPKEIEEKIVIEESKPKGEEKESPADRVKDSDISVSSNSVRINIKNAKIRNYIDSNSMDPLIDEGTTTIEVKPKSADEIKIGDIIAYDMQGYDYAFVHRVVNIGEDKEGIYFITKGDNYYKEEPKVRFNQIEGIVVGILY